MSKKIVLDSYEVVLTDVIMEAIGSSKEDAVNSIREWLDEYTKGYNLKEVRFKHHGL